MCIDRAVSTNGLAGPLRLPEGVSKGFPGVKALEGVSLSIHPGEIHAFMGELAEKGAAILMWCGHPDVVGSAMSESPRMGDRILVMREGDLVGEMPRSQASNASAPAPVEDARV